MAARDSPPYLAVFFFLTYKKINYTLKMPTKCPPFLILILFVYSMINSSCATNSINVYKNFLKTTSYSHIQSGCRFYDLNGQLKKILPGQYCQIYENGDFVSFHFPNDVIKFDSHLKKIWQSKHTLQHQIFKSIIDPNQLLTIESKYAQSKQNENVRTDSLLVLNESGQTIKQFNFKDYIEKNKLSLAWPNVWTTDGNQKTSVEKSHINSFYETYRTEGSKKILTGYVAHCNLMRKIFFFNKELTEITQEASIPGLAAHSVRPLSDHDFIFYMNEGLDQTEKNKTSEIWAFNASTNLFRPIYKNKNPESFAKMCSSVQPLTENKIFILHGSGDSVSQSNNYFEYVDLDSMDIYRHTLGSEKFNVQDGFLIDAKDFFKNNIGI